MKVLVHFIDLGTDLDKVYSDMFLELEENRDLGVLSEFEGDIDGRMFKTIVAVRKEMPRAFVGALREVAFTITGGPDDFLIEIHTTSWFNDLILPGTGSLLFGSAIGPPGMVAGVVMGSEISNKTGVIYHRVLSNKVMDLVVKYSKGPVGLRNIESM